MLDKPDLNAVGRRYDHYVELKEWALVGIDVVDRMRPSMVSDADKRIKAKLETFVEIIDIRLSYLSDYTNKVYGVNHAIDAAGIHRTPLIQGATDDITQAVSEPNPSKAEDSETDLGDVTTA